MGASPYTLKNGTGVAVICGVEVACRVDVMGIAVGMLVGTGVTGAAQAENNSNIKTRNNIRRMFIAPLMKIYFRYYFASMAHRNPIPKLGSEGCVPRNVERTRSSLRFHEPPRNTWVHPVAGPGGFESGEFL